MPAKARSRRPTARAETVALPRRRRGAAGRGRTILLRHLPSRRSVAVGLGIVAAALGAYAIARGTSLFALDRIDVRGGSAQIDAQVQHAVAPLVGTSLVGLDGGNVLRRVEALPAVVSATYDRAFPHTLRITIVPERPVAVVRSGVSAWLVSRRGRVLEKLSPQADSQLPRIWLGAKSTIRLGDMLPPAAGGGAARALASAGSFSSRVASASLVAGSLVFHLRSGIDLLLGGAGGVPLKVAVAEQALSALPAGSRFLDVSVPGRPVAGSRVPSLGSQRSSSRG